MKKQYRVVSPINHDGKALSIGDLVEMYAHTGASLLESGCLEEVDSETDTTNSGVVDGMDAHIGASLQNLVSSSDANGVSGESKKAQDDNLARIGELTAEIEELKATSLKNQAESEKLISDLTIANEALIAENDLLKSELVTLNDRTDVVDTNAHIGASLQEPVPAKKGK